ncbi:hypothetical protein COCVIDRAFT_39337 [Bipolaris victoriae FI3]|uniref:NB-ARC domain-containing protein n=1 Tax=Bipolaris victoriae (strain FI3) TaxID=930091 RepID=W7EEB2_BIPV3|nr:hypothetical protein COCVIDRAFT_39337 [Bipolaris victoriae FI3]
MQVLEEALIGIPLTTSHRKVVVVHGLSGVGKTQLVVEFARKHHHQFSAVFWLDGSSKTSLEHSFVDMVQRLPPTELTANGAQILSQAAVEAVEADVAVRECLQWLSMSLNSHWLLIIDNVDSDYHNHNQDDLPAYDVEYYFPHADHGSILITSRLASLQQLGSGVQVGAVTEEQGRAILEINARRAVECTRKTLSAERRHRN